MNKENPDKKIKKPWPTKDAMEQIYKLNFWGGDTSVFYSGSGSHNTKIIDPYIEAVTTFLESFESLPIVCDLGCGDFNVGKEFVKHSKKYIAVDIVDELITYNKNTFIADNLEFRCLDIAKDELPSGDCAILRQVLQHLSNTEIESILTKLVDYKYVIVTEHIPGYDFEPNKDIISGQGIRLKKQSGVEVLASPFNFKIKEEKILTSIILEGEKGVIATCVYKMY